MLEFLQQCRADELIVAKEHFAECGDDLDFTFVDLIEGVEPIWTYRRPKPPTPPPREPSPPKIVASVAAAVEGAAVSAEGVPVSAEPRADGEVGAVAAPVAKEPSPFVLEKHFPPDGAEVPFVKSFESPDAPKPEPSPAPEEKAPTPAPEPEPEPEAAPAEEAPAAEEAAAPSEEAPAE